MTNPLEAFGSRWNKKVKVPVAFAPQDRELMPGVIPLGIEGVDALFSGGLPRGRTTIFIGEESSGKTLLSQLFMAAAQRQGGKAVFIDAERTFDAGWFAKTGVDISDEKLLILRPRDLEMAMDMCVDALDELSPDILVLDSLAMLVPKTQMAAQMGEKDFQGLTPRKLTEGVKKITAANKSTAVVLINQLRTALGVTYGNPESQPGGKGLRYAASVILRCRRGSWLTTSGSGADTPEDFEPRTETKDDARRIGFMLRLRMDKSKVSVPFEEFTLKYYWGEGKVDEVSALVSLALSRGVIKARAAGYYTLRDKTIHGREALERAVNDPEVIAYLKEELALDG